jgi:hypothetical protein
MTTLLLERSRALGEEGFEHDGHRWLDGAPVTGQADAHGGLTLDDLITSVWEGLAVRDTVSCPVCAGPMMSSPPVDGDGLPSGDCLRCGSCLS